MKRRKVSQSKNNLIPVKKGKTKVSSRDAKEKPQSKLLVTPNRWFDAKFPELSSIYGKAVSEHYSSRSEKIVPCALGEDFFAATFGNLGSPAQPVVFVREEERFYRYVSKDGIFVQQSEPSLTADLSALLFECARACGEGCQTDKLEFGFRKSAALSGVIRRARGLLEVPSNYFSKQTTDFVTCANGMLRLADRTLLPFAPTYRRRNKLTVPYDSTATCPLFLGTLMRPALEPEDLDLLQRWCGLALLGENLAQAILILTGTAGGGKGTFVRVLTGIIGEANLAALRSHLLGERFELGRYLGKTLLYGPDVPGDFLNVRGASVLKSLTGYDPITLEFKGSNDCPKITCMFNVIVTSNSRLRVHLDGDADAWRRRLAIIDYRNPKTANPIPNLDQQILSQEGSGVLNWMLEGLDKIRADGWQLRLSENQRNRVDDLLLESESPTVFAEHGLERSEGQSLTINDCHAGYLVFCAGRSWKPLARGPFSPLIQDSVARIYGNLVRHDICDQSDKDQRGWKDLAIREKFRPSPNVEPRALVLGQDGRQIGGLSQTATNGPLI